MIRSGLLPSPSRITQLLLPMLSTFLLMVTPAWVLAGGLTCDDISCAPGYHCVDSPEGPHCVANTCAETQCGPGFWCYDSANGPLCVPVLTCDFISCAEGYHCVDTPNGPGCQPNDPVGVLLPTTSTPPARITSSTFQAGKHTVDQSRTGQRNPRPALLPTRQCNTAAPHHGDHN